MTSALTMGAEDELMMEEEMVEAAAAVDDEEEMKVLEMLLYAWSSRDSANEFLMLDVFQMIRIN